MVTLRTNGWDVVAAIRQKTLNDTMKALYDKGILPNHISETIHVPLVGDATVTLDFDPMTFLLDTGNPDLVQINFPVTDGKIETKIITIPIPLGLTITVTSDLQYVHLKFEDDQQVLRLAVDFTSAAAVYDVKVDCDKWDPQYNELLAEALKKFLQAEAEQHDYDHPFHIADITLPDGVPAELEPNGQADFVTQIVDQSETGDDNIVALLVATGDSGPGYSDDFSATPPLVPEGHVSSAVVSNEALIKKVIVDQVADAFSIPATSFTVSGGGKDPCTAALNTHPYLGTDFKVYIWNASVKVGDNQTVDVDYEVHAHPYVDTKETFYIKVTGSMSFKVEVQEKEEDGVKKQYIVLTGDASTPKGKIECAWWVYPIVVAAILVTFGTLSLAFAAISAVVVSVLLATLSFPIGIPNDIDQKLHDGLFSVQWPLQDYYPLDEKDGVTLPGDLIVCGTPQLDGGND